MLDLDFLIIPNPDVKKRKDVVQRIHANDGFCITQEPKEKCHCAHFKETGECLCGLFIRIPVVEVTT